jgi:glycosyltransferase involved in cell wall biosynthesis
VNRTGPHLAAAIRSVLDQTYGAFEFLIGANACSDDLVREIETLTRGDPRVRLFRTSLPQLAFTLNFLVEHAQTEWVVRMDADDVCEPRRFELLQRRMVESDASVIGSWATLIDADDRVIGTLKTPLKTKEIRRRLIFGTAFCHPTVAFRRSFWLRLKGYGAALVTEDYDLWLRAYIRDRSVTAENIPERLLRYRVHPGQASRSRLGYAESCGHWYREFVLNPGVLTFAGWLISTAKAVLAPIRNAIRTARP